MTPRLPALLVLAAVVVAGCSSSSGDPGPSGTGMPAVVVAKPGATRVFAVERGHHRSTRTLTLLAVHTVGSDLRETVRSSEPGVETYTAVLTLHPDGSVDEPAETTTLVDGARLSFSGFTVPTAKTLRSGTVVHESRTITYTRQGRVLRAPVTTSVNGDKALSVRVPAGTFLADPVTVIQDFELGGQAFTGELTADVVPGLGAVRYVYVTTVGNRTQTVTEVLERYHGGSGPFVQA